jgi:hypothetical protein
VGESSIVASAGAVTHRRLAALIGFVIEANPTRCHGGWLQVWHTGLIALIVLKVLAFIGNADSSIETESKKQRTNPDRRPIQPINQLSFIFPRSLVSLLLLQSLSCHQ